MEEKEKNFVVGVDVGGQTTKLGVVDARGEVLAQSVIRTDTYGADAEAYISALAEAIKKVVEDAGKKGQIRGVGVGAPNGNYYTGAIFEVKAKDVQIGSICGGGRYDNLTGIFGMPDVSGVGISFGADRIYDVLTELDAFPADLAQAAQVLFINFGPAEQAACVKAAARLRAEGIATLVYPEAAKMKKQMEYANRKQVPFVAFIGETELKDGTVTLKNMIDGNQTTMSIDELIAVLG